MAGTQAGTAVFVVRNDGTFILQKRAKPEPGAGGGLWSVPGGRIENGEEWQEAGFREVREETGILLCHPAKLVAVTTTAGLTSGWLTVWMACPWPGGSVTLNSESSDWDWTDCGNLWKYDLWKAHWTPLLDEVGGTRALHDLIVGALP